MTLWFFAIAATMIFAAALFVFRPVARAGSGTHSRVIVIAACTVVVLASTGLYASIGRPDAIGAAPHAAQRVATGGDAPAATSRKDVASVGSLVDGLAAKLEQNPEDGSGWLLLAKSYAHLGRDDDARAAYARAAELGFTDDAFEASVDEGNQAGAGQAVSISGRVTLKGDAPASGGTVYVIAKRSDGSPMPLAVLRRPVADLPFEFTLSDANSMVKGGGLSSVDTVIVSAKISSTGDAFNTDPRYETQSSPVSTASAPFLELEIDPGS